MARLVWYRADAVSDPLPPHMTNIAQWDDISGNGHHATSVTAVQQPRFESNVQNGLPGVFFSVPDIADFDYADRMRLPDILSDLTQGEAFLVHKRYNHAPPDHDNELYSGLWLFSSSDTGQPSKYPKFTDGDKIYDSFGSDVVHQTATAGATIYDAHIYNVSSQAYRVGLLAESDSFMFTGILSDGKRPTLY